MPNVTPQTSPSQASAAFPPAARVPRMLRPGPLAGRYPAVAAMVVLFLVPYLALSAALQPITPLIASSLHMSLQATSLTSGMANAAYAAGTVLAVQFAQHLPQRRMMLAYAVFLVIASALTAAATTAEATSANTSTTRSSPPRPLVSRRSSKAAATSATVFPSVWASTVPSGVE